jgi:hypothetical protein
MEKEWDNIGTLINAHQVEHVQRGDQNSAAIETNVYTGERIEIEVKEWVKVCPCAWLIKHYAIKRAYGRVDV